jgi:hypothetical protein
VLHRSHRIAQQRSDVGSELVRYRDPSRIRWQEPHSSVLQTKPRAGEVDYLTSMQSQGGRNRMVPVTPPTDPDTTSNQPDTAFYPQATISSCPATR